MTEGTAVQPLSMNEVEAIWNALPGGPSGWMKTFGYRQFAQKIESAVSRRYAARIVERKVPTDEEIIAVCESHGLGPNVGLLVGRDLLARFTAPPDPLARNLVLEEVARHWDGCDYEMPGETVDIGAAIREMKVSGSAPVAAHVYVESLQMLRRGVEMDRHNLDDGDAKLAALDTAIAVLSTHLSEHARRYEGIRRAVLSSWTNEVATALHKMDGAEDCITIDQFNKNIDAAISAMSKEQR